MGTNPNTAEHSVVDAKTTTLYQTYLAMNANTTMTLLYVSAKVYEHKREHQSVVDTNTIMHAWGMSNKPEVLAVVAVVVAVDLPGAVVVVAVEHDMMGRGVVLCDVAWSGVM